MTFPEQVDTNLYRGPLPDLLMLKTLQSIGVKTVLSLDGGIFELMRGDENHEVSNMFNGTTGMELIHIEMSALFPPHPEDMDDALRLTQTRAPLYVHCQQGKDRTGMVCAAYHVKAQGWSIEKAVEDMWAHGFHFWYFYWLPALYRYLKQQ